MTTSTAEDGPVYLADVAHAIVRGRVLILVSTLVCMIASGVYAFHSKPIYKADVLFSVVDRGPGSRGIGQVDVFASLLGGSMFAQAGSSKSIAVLASQSLSTEFIERENLMSELFADNWDASENSWKSDARNRAPTLNEAFKFFDKKIRTISMDTKSGLATLSIEWTDPMLAASWAEKLIDLANERLRRSAIEEATRSIAYLKAELEKTEIVEVRQAIYAVMEQQMQEIMLANVQVEYAFSVIDPPVAPSEDDFIKPRRFAVVVFGLLAGLIGSSLFVIIRSRSF